MNQRDWEARFKFFLQQVTQERNDGEFVGNQRDVWMEARERTEMYAGPEPGSGVPGIGMVKGGVRAVKRVMELVRWLDGKKTVIGATLAVVADALAHILPQLPEILTLFGVEAATVAVVVGVVGKVIAAIGLIHKMIKYKRAKA